MNPLSEILKQVKSAAAVRLLEKDVKDLNKNFEDIMEYLKNRISTNTNQKTEAIQSIRSMRKSIDDHLNKLEQQRIKDLETEQSELKSKTETLLREVDKRAKQIRNLQSEFANMTKYATELQTYVGLTEIEKITSKEANYMEDIKRGPDLNERNLHVTMSHTLASILHDVESFGNITVDTSPCNVVANAGRKDQAQHLLPIPTIDQIKPSFSNTLIVLGGMRLVGSCILSDGNCVVLDSVRKSLLMFRNDGTFIRSILSFKEKPTSVCFVKNDTMAVSFYKSSAVALVDIEQSKVIRHFKFSHPCGGVSSDGQLMVITKPTTKDVIVMNLQDDSKEKLRGINLNHISMFKGNIFGTHLLNNTVSCYKLCGQYKSQDIDAPLGIALDKNGFIYVACRKCNNIVVVAPDGKSSRAVLNTDNGIMNPRSISIDIESGIMLVTSQTDGVDALLFKL